MNLVEQLRARRRVTAAARARRPAKLSPIEAPPAAVASYTAALVALNRELDAAIVRELAPLVLLQMHRGARDPRLRRLRARASCQHRATTP